MKYKCFLYLLLYITLPLLSFGNNDVQALFDKGNQLYAKAQYPQALVVYQQVLKAGYQSAPLYFNMGNASYRNNDVASAILYYEKARKLAPGDEDINFNIRFANLRTADRVEEAPEFFLTRWWHNFILALSLDALAIISIGLMLLAGLTLIAYLFTQSVTFKKVSFYSAIIIFFFSLAAIFVANRQSNYFESHHQAIIFSGTVTVKSSPASSAKALFVLHEGTKVDVIGTNNNRLRIKLANGSEGWIGISDVKEI
jgi:tetratricopeptide (TPR) repeat protein